MIFDGARWSKLCGLLQELPPKTSCDELLQSFLLRVRPLNGLVHGPTLVREYDAFWEQDHQHTKMPEAGEAMHQASFFCLLWAVLFCGSAASAASTGSVEPSHQDPVSLMSPASLRSRFDETFSLCRQTDLPTLYGLTASLLVHECNFWMDEVLDTPPLISQSILAARSLGLHSEDRIKARNNVEGEMCRRVWHFILRQDAFGVICAGSSLSPLANADTYDTRLPLDASDAELEAGITCMDTGAPRSVNEGATSSSMMGVVAVSEAFRVVRSVVRKCYGTRPPTNQDIEEVTTEIRCLFEKLDRLAVKLKTRGLPEQGQISARLYSADDLVANHTHNDSPQDETAFNAYVRISFSFAKAFVALQFGASFLDAGGSPNHEASEVFASIFPQTSGSEVRRRTSNLGLELIGQCISFLTNFIYLARLPAFSPYRWYIPARVQPLLPAGLILGYLEQVPTTPELQRLNYVLEEVFEIYLHPDGRPKLPFTGGPDSWNALQRRHQGVKARASAHVGDILT